MFKEFLEKEGKMINFTAVIAALGALFLNIKLPENENAVKSLVNIQVFWLIILIICLSVLFLNFSKQLIKLDKTYKTFGIFFLPTIYIFFWIILNLLNYIVNFNIKYSSFFIGIIVLTSIVWLFVGSMNIFENNENKFSLFSNGIIWGFYMSSMTILFFVILQIGIFKFVSFIWFWLVLPILFIIFFSLFVISSIYRRKISNNISNS